MFINLCHSNIVNPKVFYDGDVDIGNLLNAFFANTWENDSWPELDWFTNKLYFVFFFFLNFQLIVSYIYD